MGKMSVIVFVLISFSIYSDVNDGMKFIPAHESWPAFWIDSTEVTQEAWMELMDENPSFHKEALCPVEQVSWYDAARYANERSKFYNLDTAYTGSGSSMSFVSGTNGFRLPEREEWRFAAENYNSVTTCYWGDCAENTGEYAWYGGMYFNGGFNPHPVAEKKPNSNGLYDISGNVSEWTNTTFSQNMSMKEYRGGHYITDSIAEEFQTRYINYENPNDKSYTRGFRLVRSDMGSAIDNVGSIKSHPVSYTVKAGEISFKSDRKIEAIRIFDLKGSLVKMIYNSNSVHFNESSLSKGLYIFQINTKETIHKEIIPLQ